MFRSIGALLISFTSDKVTLISEVSSTFFWNWDLMLKVGKSAPMIKGFFEVDLGDFESS